MIKKVYVFLSVVCFALVVSGCYTIKGAAEGAADGAKKDVEAAKKVDRELQKELW